MKKSSSKRDQLEEKNDMDDIGQPEDMLRKTLPRRQRPKREGCVGVSLAGNVTTPLQNEKAFMRAALAGDAATFLAGKTTTALAGGALTSLAGRPGTSLFILAKKEIPQGAVIKKPDLEAYVILKSVTGLDESVSRENPVGKIAKKYFPAHSLLASVGLFGNPSTPVTDVKLPPGNALVIRTKKPIKKGAVIQEEDLEVSVISSPIKNRDMYDRKEVLVGMVATEAIPEDKIVKKSMVN